MARKKTVRTLQKCRDAGQPIVMVTAYDATFARLFEEAGVDAILVGDSLGNVIQGRGTTLPVTVEEIAYHTRCVVRGAPATHIVADMPFGSYGTGVESAVQNAAHLMKEGDAHAVKLEGGRQLAETVHRMVSIGIPVMGHLGFTPQSVHKFGGHYIQGKGDAADALVEDARILEEAGAYGIVLEMVPAALAERVTAAVAIPTIGIGAGAGTSGQVLVCYDLLGLNDGFQPRFLKHFAQLAQPVRDAVGAYADEVRAGTYPAEEHTFADDT